MDMSEPATPATVATIKNPILRGFNPDPSILRVGTDYYIATSTFEWFPGVQIHHSKDLVNWRMIKRPLERVSQLDMLGNPDSGGVWAPCLSYCDGVFHLIYSNVRKWKGDPYKIVDNYLVTAPSIEGPWSEPVYLNSSGFDPSLFHDEDGRKWLVSMEWDHRNDAAERMRFTGILLQEYSPSEKKLVGPVTKIFEGTDIGLVEGPHLYRLKGYYYLLTAEGGTEYTHAVSMARSRSIDGPYDIHPENPLVTSVSNPELALQKAGHGSLVETQNGEWYLAHLCGRPIDGKHCILGRETALQKCVWRDDDWIYLASGTSDPEVNVPAPEGLDPEPTSTQAWNGFFSTDQLDINFQSLRRPVSEDWLSLSERPGWLRLKGDEPTVSCFRQSLIARRVQAFHTETSTELDFQPESFKQMAGLIAYYDTENHYYLRVSHDEKTGRGLNIIRTAAAAGGEILEEDIPLPDEGTVHLKVSIQTTDVRFAYSIDGESWNEIGPVLESAVLSDDFNHLGFTGAFVGLCAQDQVTKGHPADFKYFKYLEFPDVSDSQ
jgi:xylan 1,4-beta-xylosidase